MYRFTYLFFCLTGVFALKVYAQEVRVSGRISSRENGEALQDASVYNTRNQKFVRCNQFGFYSLSMPRGMNMLVVQAPGFKTDTIMVNVASTMSFDFQMSEWAEQLADITIIQDEGRLKHGSGNFRISGSQAGKVPVALSEPDLLKALQLFPGVQGGADGTSGIHVRGGSPDQTLILIDGVPIYNVNHLFGFFSVFNPDVIASADLYKSELPSRYSGRLSSVLDITMREGNRKKMAGGFQISPISMKLRLEGPIKKDTSSYLISFRRTWLDVLASLTQRIANTGSVGYLGFSDATGKVNYRFNKREQLFLSVYWGNDAFGARSKSAHDASSNRLSWGNLTSAARYQRIFGNSVFSHTTLSYNHYRSQFKNVSRILDNRYSTLVRSSIADWSLKSDWSYNSRSGFNLEWGGALTRHLFNPDILRRKGDVYDNSVPSADSSRTVVADVQVYGELEYKTGPFDLRAGFNFAGFMVNGSAYNLLQPRFGAKFAIAPTLGIKAAYFQSAQYLHLLTNSSVGMPTDLWVPVTESIAPQRSEQFSLGIYSEWKGIRLSLEGYYKWMDNLIEFTGAGRGIDNPYGTWQDRITVGQGSSKGLELYAERKFEKLDAFLSYTLSFTNRQFDLLNEGKPFPYKYDRRHVLNFFSAYNFSKHRSVQVVFQYASGSWITLPNARYSALPSILETTLSESYAARYLRYFDQLDYLPARNNFLMPSNHHLDVSYKTEKVKKRGIRTWTFSIYNLYNRRNPYFVFVHDAKLKQFSLLPVLPSVSYEYRF